MLKVRLKTEEWSNELIESSLDHKNAPKCPVGNASYTQTQAYMFPQLALRRDEKIIYESLWSLSYYKVLAVFLHFWTTKHCLRKTY